MNQPFHRRRKPTFTDTSKSAITVSGKAQLSSSTLTSPEESETDINLAENVSVTSTEKSKSPTHIASASAETAETSHHHRDNVPEKESTAIQPKKKDRKVKGKHERQPTPSPTESKSIKNYFDGLEREVEKQFVNLKDLQYQTKISRDRHHDQLQSEVHRFEHSLDEMKIRVQLLQYPSTLGKQESEQENERLQLLEGRIFSWQEKVFSQSEVELYKDKKNLSSDLDLRYHQQLMENPDATIGKYFHTYVTGDNFIAKLESKCTIRRCPAKHSFGPDNDGIQISRSNNFTTDSEHEAILNIGQSGDHGILATPQNCFARRNKSNLPNSLRQDSASRARSRAEKKKEILKGTSTEGVRKKKHDLESGNQSENNSNVDVDYDNDMKIFKQKSNRKSSNLTVETRDTKKSDWETASDSSASDQEISSVKKGRRKKRKNYRENLKTSQGRHGLKIYGQQPIWKPEKVNFNPQKFGQPQQIMYIMASIPISNKNRRKVLIGSVHTFPHAGVVLLRPSFGYQIIEAERSRFYRISWELYSDVDVERNKTHLNIQSPESNGLQKEIGSGDFPRRSQSILRNEGATVGEENKPFLEKMGSIFETVPVNEFHVQIMGEILSAVGFENSPLTLHYFLELPKGWKNEGDSSSLAGVTHTCEANKNGIVHFCQDFCFQLGFSMDSVDEDETYPTPILYLMVIYIEPRVIIKHEGYAYVPIPPRPGFHSITVSSWKPKPTTVYERIGDLVANISPSLQDIHAVYIPTNENEECRRANRLGLQTISSGSIQIRFHIIHHSATLNSEQRERLQLLEKMNSATILRSVQTVIEAFQRARKKAANAAATTTL